MEQVKNISPFTASELTKKYFKWKEYVQERLDKCIPQYCWRGLRSGEVTIPLRVDITPADCVSIVHPILVDLGWKPSKEDYDATNKEIRVLVEW